MREVGEAAAALAVEAVINGSSHLAAKTSGAIAELLRSASFAAAASIAEASASSAYSSLPRDVSAMYPPPPVPPSTPIGVEAHAGVQPAWWTTLAQFAVHPQWDKPTAEAFLPWLAVLGAWLCFGSFAVPMKWPSVVRAEVDPFVFQFYKTFWTFAASFLLLFFWDFEFTWWGLVSGCLWVPAGVAAVIAVRHIGIACGQPIWQAAIILTSFFWGFVILKTDNVYDWVGTCAALSSLLGGVLGMTCSFNMRSGPPPIEASMSSCSLTERMWSRSRSGLLVLSPGASQGPSFSIPGLQANMSSRSLTERMRSRSRSGLSGGYSNCSHATSVQSFAVPGFIGQASKSSVLVGVGAALFNGIWGGANLVPSHYSQYKGVHFQISFGIGAMIVNLVVMAVYSAILKFALDEPLPSLQLRVMFVPGFVSGMLWCIGNFCALYAVSTLGQGIGYSLIQCNGIVSGLWGILYYRELKGRPILFWCLACSCCCFGVVGLAHQKQ